MQLLSLQNPQPNLYVDQLHLLHKDEQGKSVRANDHTCDLLVRVANGVPLRT